MKDIELLETLNAYREELLSLQRCKYMLFVPETRRTKGLQLPVPMSDGMTNTLKDKVQSELAEVNCAIKELCGKMNDAN